MRVCGETGIVAALCAADLLSTLVLVQHGAGEGNALMSFYLQQGTWAFIAAKCVLFVPALMIAEWYRRRNPRLISMALRGVIVMYLLLYTLGVFQVNRPERAALSPGPVAGVRRAELPEGALSQRLPLASRVLAE
jgi:hypothetical protein